MEPYEPHLAIATAIAVGLLIGLEREQSHPEGTDRSAFGGVRTYPIVALVGALATMLEPSSMWLPLVALAGLVVLLALSYADDLRKSRDRGATTEASVVATYLLGALAASRGVIEPMTDRFLLVAIVGVMITFLLSSKPWLHGLAAKVSREDFTATVQFLIVAVVVLPLLPRQAMGPLDAIQPFTVGLMVVMISGLSFIGYVAMRLLGPHRGVLVGAALGGLVSSTAVTMSFAGRTREETRLAPIAAGAIAIAGAIMVARVAVLVSVANPSLLGTLAIPLVGTAVGGLVGGVVVYRRNDIDGTGELALRNPFELGTAIRFGLVFAVILLAIKAAQVYLGPRGVVLAAALGGSTDVDAVTLSTARLGIDATAATSAILVAIASNTVVKTGLAFVIGGAAIGKRALVVGAGTIAGGALASLTLL